jgi:hypothetical protein
LHERAAHGRLHRSGEAGCIARRQLAPGNRLVKRPLEKAQRLTGMRHRDPVKLWIDQVHLQERQLIRKLWLPEN